HPDREEPRAMEVRSLDVGLGTGIRDVEVDDAGKNRLAARQPDERVSDRGEGFGRPDQITDLLFRQEEEFHHAFPFSARISRRRASIRSRPCVRYAGASPIPTRMKPAIPN